MPTVVKDAAVRKRLLVGLLLVMGLVMLIAAVGYLRPEPDGKKPVLALMTTLPLQWSEGGIEADLAAEAKPHPVYARLQQAYDIRLLDDLKALAEHRYPTLLLAQPRAFAPAELVVLDKWVRDGGQLVILADPALQWGSLYPLGDNRRPLFTSMLSPLLDHWGIELVLPMTDERQVVLRAVAGFNIRTQTPGEWIAKQTVTSSKTGCRLSARNILADCRLGKGRALLIADADFLDTVYWEGRGVRAFTGTDEFGNMAFLEGLLRALADDRDISGDIVGK
jgi:ABC-type uncharacterized transport system